MTPRDDATVLDILNACRLAIDFAANMDRTTFAADAKTQAAVIHELTVVGEAAKRLTPEFKDRVSDVPWRAIAGMRDKRPSTHPTIAIASTLLALVALAAAMLPAWRAASVSPTGALRFE